MLTVAEIHKEIRDALQGKISKNTLTGLIKEQEFLISRDVKKQLDSGFSHRHEVSFSLFALNSIVDMATDHTDYSFYRDLNEKVDFNLLLTAHQDEGKYGKDLQKLTSEGFVHMGDYHSHPYDSRIENKRRFKRRFERDCRRISNKHRFPSGGDISSWIENETKDGYIVIASKPKPSSRLNLGAYIPVGEFQKRPYDTSDLPPLPEGFSFVKPIKNYWYDDLQINKSEARELKNLLRSVLTIQRTVDKNYPRVMNEYYFIEVPVRIKDKPY